jgi:putative Holliday junction resolvase
MALDVGDRRIGIAITDALGITVQGRPTWARTSPQADIGHLREIVETDGVAAIVIGHPLNMDGSGSAQTRKVEAFARRVEADLGVAVHLWDERLTSFAADQDLEAMGFNWKKRRKHVDELAATLILEDYLASGQNA